MSQGSGNIRRFVDPKLFAASTDEGLFEATSNRYRDSVLTLLNDYRALSTPGTTAIPDKSVSKALSYVNAMVDFAEDYLRQPTTASEEDAREGFALFLGKARQQQAELKQRLAAKGGKESSVPVDPRAKTLRKHMPGDPGKLFDKVGMAVDIAVPKNGDKASFTVELTFPTPSGVNVKGSMSVAAERADDRLKANTRIMLGAGIGKKELVEFSATIGGYLEAEAGDPKSLGALLERALYDRVKSTPGVPSELLGYLFGTGGDAGGALVAQERMAAIDSKRLKGANYSEQGGALEAKVEGEEAVTATGGGTWGKRRDASGGPGRAVDGINYSVKLENPMEIELQVQGKRIDADTKRPKLIASEFSAEVFLDQAWLVQLQKTPNAAQIASLIMAALRTGVGLVAEIANANGKNTGLTAARMFAGVTAATGQLVWQLTQLQKGLPSADPPAGPKKGISGKAAVGLGIKGDLVNNKVSVVIRHITEIALNAGVGAVTATRSSEAGVDVVGGQPKK